jgi:tetratricopeptide (TPR) repeat protein
MSEKYPKKLQLVRKILDSGGDKKHALKIIEEYEKESIRGEPYYNLLAKILKSRVKLHLNEYDESLALAESAREESKKRGEKILEFKALLNISNVYLQIGKFIEGMEEAEKAEKILEVLDDKDNEFLKNKTSLYLLKGGLYTRLGEFDRALEITKTILNWLNDLDDKNMQTRALLNVGNIYLQKGNSEKALNYYFKGLEMAKTMGKMTANYAFLFNNIGVVYRRIGETEKALEYYQRGLQGFQELGNDHAASLMLHNIGNVYQMMGEVNRSLDYFMQALVIREKYGNNDELGMTYHDIGATYNTKGELDLAIKYIQKGLKARESVGNKFEIIQSLNGLGGVYQRKGEIKKAFELYKKALKESRQFENTLLRSDVLTSFIDILLEKQEIGLAKEYLKELESLLKESNNNKIIEAMYYNIKATILKSEEGSSGPLSFKSIYETLDKIIQSQNLLEKVIEDDITHGVTVDAIFKLSELYMVELRVLGKEEVLREIIQMTDKLEAISKKQNSYSLMAKTFLFQAHLAILQGKDKEGKGLLEEAYNIASEKGFEKLAEVITKEQKRLKGVLPENGEKTSLLDRMNKLQLDGLVTSLRQDRVEFFSGKKEAKPSMSDLFSFAQTLKKRDVSW